MIILPIGHDHTIRRIPWVTIGIMIVCTLIQLQRTVFAPWPREVVQVEGEVHAADKALIASLMQRLGPKGLNAPTLDGKSEVPATTASDAISDSEEAPRDDSPLVVAFEQGSDLDQIVARVHAGTLGDDSDASVARVHAAQKSLAALEKRDIAFAMTYVPSKSPWSPNLLLSAFAHNGLLHLAGNLVFLWLCGCNLEDRWGKAAYAAFYGMAAIASSFAFMLVHRHDGAGIIGASGAIAATMGAFLVCFARARIKWMYIMWWKPRFFYSPALVAFPIWFIAQVGQVILEASGDHGVAFSAHVGGFAFGVIVAGGLRLSHLDEKVQRLAEGDDQKGWEEHPDFIKALPLVETDPATAVMLLRQVLIDRPLHEDARLSLVHAAARVGDIALLAEVLPRVIARLSTGERWAEVVSLAAIVEPAIAPSGALMVDERTSAQLLHAAVEGGDAKLCLRLARGHQLRFAQGATMPRVLWDVAMAQRHAGALPQSQQTLQRLRKEFPQHPLAERARQAIEAPGVDRMDA